MSASEKVCEELALALSNLENEGYEHTIRLSADHTLLVNDFHSESDHLVRFECHNAQGKLVNVYQHVSALSVHVELAKPETD